MALGWTWCFAAAGTWSRGLTWLSVLTWGALVVGSVALLLPAQWRPPSVVVGAANGVGFPLLLVWLIAVTERVLRRSRPDGAHGRMAPWRHPWPGLAGRAVNAVAESRFLRALCEWLPLVGLRSDITDVIYVNYLVEAERLVALVPPRLELQRLGPGGRLALFTSLTYRHGHFGPGLAGPLRRLMPSPVQSNWRIYVRDPQTTLDGIYFVTNAIASTPHALAARMLSEGMPMHVPRRGAVVAEKDGSFTVALDPGNGTAPDLEGRLRPGAAELAAAWAECFASYRDFLAYCVPQDRALSAQPWYGRITRQEIRLGIPLGECEPLQGEVRSSRRGAIRRRGGGALLPRAVGGVPLRRGTLRLPATRSRRPVSRSPPVAVRYRFRCCLRGSAGRPAVSRSRYCRICSGERPARRSSAGRACRTSRRRSGDRRSRTLRCSSGVSCGKCSRM